MSRTPTWRSSCATRLLSLAFASPVAFAAAVKPPWRTTCAKKWRSFRSWIVPGAVIVSHPETECWQGFNYNLVPPHYISSQDIGITGGNAYSTHPFPLFRRQCVAGRHPAQNRHPIRLLPDPAGPLRKYPPAAEDESGPAPLPPRGAGPLLPGMLGAGRISDNRNHRSLSMSIGGILEHKSADVVSIRAGAIVTTAVKEMRAHNIAALVVKQNDRIVGVLSERDIVNAIARHGENALSMPVESALSHSLVTIASSDSVKHAMRLMTHHRTRH